MTDANDILERIGALAPLPDTAVRLMNVVNDPSSTVEDIVDAIRYDQAVTTDMLKLCNSAYFGLSRQVTSLNDAMMFLGTVKILQLVMAIHSNSLLRQGNKGYGLEPGMLWKHSVAVALAAEAIAQRLEAANVNLLYTAGLLHDIGKVVLNEHVAEDFAEIVRRVTQDQCAFIEAEQAVLGFSHTQVGAMLAERWNLPEPIVRCIRYHHEPWALDPPDPLVDGIYIANTVCLLMGIGLGEDGLCYRADSEVMHRHGLTENDLESVGLTVATDLKRVEQMFGIGAGAGTTTVGVGK